MKIEVYKPWEYQEFAEDHIIDNPFCGLFLGMGLGKTVVTLTAIDRLLFDYMEAGKVLVIGPKTVVDDVWTTEGEKWKHLRHLRMSKVLGTVSERMAGLRAKADIYLINRENLPWLVNLYGMRWPFKIVVVDELSSFKSQKASRFRQLKKVRPLIDRLIGLTGTPASNGLLDLWAPMYLIDQGERLGKTITAYRNKYFIPSKYQGHIVYKYELKGTVAPGSKKQLPLFTADWYEKEIYEKISDICVSMSAEDYLDMPPFQTQDVFINLPPAIRKKYKQFEREQVLGLDNGEEITPASAAVLSNKLLQFANGAVYDDDRVAHSVHSKKLDALEEIIEAAQGTPQLILYWFKSDLKRIKARLKKYKPVVFKGREERIAWNEGKIKVLLLHPMSGGHGNNLQYGGYQMTWFAHTWSSELYQQAVTRIFRQGQTMPVINRRLIVRGTMDEDVIRSGVAKLAGEKALMDAVKARIEKYKRSTRTPVSKAENRHRRAVYV